MSQSSIESEYRAIALASVEIIWLRSFCVELCVLIASTPILFTDSISAQTLCHNPMFHAKTKHIKMDHRFLCDQVIQGTLIVDHIPSSDQIANYLTKHVPFFLFFKPKLMVLPKL